MVHSEGIWNNLELLCQYLWVIGWCLSVVSSSPIKGSCCFLETETLPSLFSTGWLQKRIRAWFTKTKIA